MSCLFIKIYMSAIAGQTAKLNGLTFFKEANGYSRGNKG